MALRFPRESDVASVAEPETPPADTNSIAFSRTPQQVLSIVYLGGHSQGRFFPNGVNGSFTVSAS